MRFNRIGINTKDVEDKIRLCFYIYFILVIIEGALRKWVIPWATSIVPVFRDPIVIYALYVGLKNDLLRGNWTKFYFWISIVAFVTTMLFGHQNIIVAIYGFRIFGFHFPAMILWSKTLTKNDLNNISKIMVYLIIPMAILIILQYISPSSAWVNRGTEGEDSTSTFGGVGEYHRPSGTFSFSAGLVRFEFLATCCVLYEWFNQNKLVNKKILIFSTIALLISIFTCLARALIVEVILVLAIFILLSIRNRKQISKMSTFVLVGTVVFFATYQFVPYFRKTIDVLTARFEKASKAEGDFIEGSLMGRMGGQYIRAFTDTQNFSGKPIPLFGFGLGGGTAVGRNLMKKTGSSSFTYAEQPWSVTICESGYIIGAIMLLIGRTLFTLNYALISIKRFLRTNDWLAITFLPTFVISIFASQLSVPTNLGFTIIEGALLLGAISHTQKKLQLMGRTSLSQMRNSSKI